MTDEKIILSESDEAAQYRTITGWVDRHGRYWADDERMARWAGATHLHCDTCGDVIKKHGYTICDVCREKRDIAAYAKYKTQPYDGGWCYSETHECFFEDEDEVEEYMAENEVTWEELRMCATTPNYLFTIDEDTWCDVFPEEGADLPFAVDEALSALNSAIEKSEPVSYSPTKIALTRKPRYEMINDRYGECVKIHSSDEFEQLVEKSFGEPPVYDHIDEDGNIHYTGPDGPEETLRKL